MYIIPMFSCVATTLPRDGSFLLIKMPSFINSYCYVLFIMKRPNKMEVLASVCSITRIIFHSCIRLNFCFYIVRSLFFFYMLNILTSFLSNLLFIIYDCNCFQNSPQKHTLKSVFSQQISQYVLNGEYIHMISYGSITVLLPVLSDASNYYLFQLLKDFT